jgi:hypothetical protein
MVEAEAYGRASVGHGQGQQRVNSFQWVGLWPVIGVVLAQEKIAEAMDCVHMLLDPTQQPPDEQLRTLLEMALQAWDAGQEERTRTLLQEAAPLAEKMGYL